MPDDTQCLIESVMLLAKETESNKEKTRGKSMEMQKAHVSYTTNDGGTRGHINNSATPIHAIIGEGFSNKEALQVAFFANRLC